MYSQGSPKGDQQGGMVRSGGKVGHRGDRGEEKGRHIDPVQAGRSHTWPPESILPDRGMKMPETVHQREG